MERKRAVVVGGSVAGLTAASVLASRMAEVVLVERHQPSLARPSTSGQGHLPHVLLAAGARVFEELHPGFADELVAHGAVTGPDPTRVPCHWLAAGALRDHLAATGRTGTYEGDKHWNTEGHAVVAQALASFVAELVPHPRP